MHRAAFTPEIGMVMHPAAPIRTGVAVRTAVRLVGRRGLPSAICRFQAAVDVEAVVSALANDHVPSSCRSAYTAGRMRTVDNVPRSFRLESFLLIDLATRGADAADQNERRRPHC